MSHFGVDWASHARPEAPFQGFGQVRIVGSDKTRTRMDLSGVRLGMSRNGLLGTQEPLEVDTRDVLSQKGPDLDHPRPSLPLVCRSCEIWCMMVNTLTKRAGGGIAL